MNTYDRFRAMAIRRLSLVSEGGLGEVIQITRKIGQQYDPDTSTTVQIFEVYKSTGLRVNFRRFDIDNTLVKENDVNFYISPLATQDIPDPDWIPDVGETEADRPTITVSLDTPAIQTTDVIEFLGVKYAVINVRPWNHAGVSIGFKVQGRVV